MKNMPFKVRMRVENERENFYWNKNVSNPIELKTESTPMMIRNPGDEYTSARHKNKQKHNKQIGNL